ncbi:hypothetical protein BBJ29_003305 [Phytophthora kernoviae]|uniref:MULE transposase domain-containing protein n=1 Tax=Phytophthora kernoviae TaxID=325452 RepID=A0A3F2RM29_9STRA|nr:hypothetical protein BBJ29_003305 [Phytophthora kernoviae]RLN60312.1 hypothetical protein BBP00_00006058 [Phytophthora kernoviae]
MASKDVDVDVETATTPTAPAAPTLAELLSVTGANKPSLPAKLTAPFSQFNRLDKSDVDEARTLGLLSSELPISSDSTAPEFGIAYEKKGGTKTAGCGADVFSSQKVLQERCKLFAMQRGFQLIVSCSSTRPNGGGNVKYRCKKLNGQQFFDSKTPASELQCPFYVNGYGKDGAWKVTRACLLHNHYKFIGSKPAPTAADHSIMQPAALSAVSSGIQNAVGVTDMLTMQPQSTLLLPGENVPTVGEGQDAVHGVETPTASSKRVRMQRNTTMSMKALCLMVTDEVNKYPASNVVMAKLDGKMIKRILLGQGHSINHMMASRIKRHMEEVRVNRVRASFQKLGSYLKVVAEKNPGSLFQMETTGEGRFKRALFISKAGLDAVQFCRKIVSLDHITHSEEVQETPLGKLEDDENDDAICGVYLKASTKDFNDGVVTFALALVAKEDQDSWEWFLQALQNSQAVDWNGYTVLAGRTRGLQPALRSVWPQASHHYCLRRVVEDELVMAKKIPMTLEKRQCIFDLARSDSETEYDTLRKALIRTSEAAVAYLDGLNRENWVKYAFLEAFRRPTFNELTSDLSMSLGSDELFSQHASASHISWFGEDPVHSSQPLYIFNQYFMKIAENFHKRRQSVSTHSPQELVPLRDAQLQQILQGSQRCEMTGQADESLAPGLRTELAVRDTVSGCKDINATCYK